MLLGAFARDRSGSALMFAGFALTLMICAAGVSIEYWYNLSYKQRYAAASDAASLAAVNAAIAFAQSSPLTGQALIDGAKAAGKTQALNVFYSNVGAFELGAGQNGSLGNMTPTINMAYNAPAFVATVAYSGQRPNAFGSLFSTPFSSIAGSSTATAAPPTYINFYIVIDTSNSMGLAATTTDQAALWKLTNQAGYVDDGEVGCTFGCHVSMHNNAQGQPLPSNEDLAHANGVTLRIDSARTAVQNILNIAKTQAVNGNIQFGLYTMQLNPTSGTNLVNVGGSISSNYSQLLTTLGAIDLGSNTTAGVADSDMTDALSNLATLLPANGTGLNAASPLNYVLVVTDGLVDTPGSCAYGHCVQVLPATACSGLQAKASVGVVYTTYLPIYNNNDQNQGYDWTYNNIVLPVASNFVPNLTACASNPNQFFQADNGPALISAMQNYFVSSLAQARITN